MCPLEGILFSLVQRETTSNTQCSVAPADTYLCLSVLKEWHHRGNGHELLLAERWGPIKVLLGVDEAVTSRDEAAAATQFLRPSHAESNIIFGSPNTLSDSWLFPSTLSEVLARGLPQVLHSVFSNPAIWPEAQGANLRRNQKCSMSPSPRKHPH